MAEPGSPSLQADAVRPEGLERSIERAQALCKKFKEKALDLTDEYFKGWRQKQDDARDDRSKPFPRLDPVLRDNGKILLKPWDEMMGRGIIGTVSLEDIEGGIKIVKSRVGNGSDTGYILTSDNQLFEIGHDRTAEFSSWQGNFPATFSMNDQKLRPLTEPDRGFTEILALMESLDS